MRKKIFAVALAATMALTSAITAFGATAASLNVTAGWANPGGNTGLESLTGDFDVTYTFNNARVSGGDQNWFNYVLQIIDNGNFINVRADAFAFTDGPVFGVTFADPETTNLKQSWSGQPADWAVWITDMGDADVELNIVRTDNVFTIEAVMVGPAPSSNTYTFNATLTMNAAVSETIDLTLTGEKVNLTNIAFVNNAKEQSSTKETTEETTEETTTTEEATTVDEEATTVDEEATTTEDSANATTVASVDTSDVATTSVILLALVAASMVVVLKRKKVTE